MNKFSPSSPVRSDGRVRASQINWRKLPLSDTPSCPPRRVELQFRRKALRRFGVETIYDLLGNCGHLVRWGVGSWFRLTAKVPDRGHTERAEVSAEWKIVQEAIETAFPIGGEAKRRHVR